VTVGRAPSLRTEKQLLADGHLAVVGSDEVGRGALSGPVSAGVVVVDESVRRQPTGLRDSKLLSPAEREALVPRIRKWAVAYAVGHASAAEIDRYGILAALRLAGERALGTLGFEPSIVLLDGNYDWYTRPLRAEDGRSPGGFGADASLERRVPEKVVLKVKADLVCASVAAASVLAKVERDGMMADLASSYPDYGWHENKGYSTPQHSAALRELGPSNEHRRSWRLACLDGEQLELDLGLSDPSAAPAPARR
jgi:ribonuclease HII